MTLFKH